jgi:hypothetical protein
MGLSDAAPFELKGRKTPIPETGKWIGRVLVLHERTSSSAKALSADYLCTV